MTFKKIKNDTSSDIMLNTVGMRIKAGSEYEINSTEYARFAERETIEELESLVNNGSLVIHDGVNYITSGSYGILHLKYPDKAFNQRFLSHPERPNGLTKKTTQEAIEEVKDLVFDSDVYLITFGRKGVVTNHYLYTSNTVSSYTSPNPVAYNSLLKGWVFSNSNNVGSCRIIVNKISSNYVTTTQIINTTLSGYEDSSDILNISLNKDECLSVRLEAITNPKPKGVNVNLLLAKC
jgi:hypothetical protein